MAVRIESWSVADLIAALQGLLEREPDARFDVRFNDDACGYMEQSVPECNVSLKPIDGKGPVGNGDELEVKALTAVARTARSSHTKVRVSALGEIG